MSILSGVCRQCFVQCYECSHGYLDNICASIKRGEDTTVASLGDNTAAYVYSDTFKSALTEMARSEYIVLNHEHIAAMQIPNTVQSLSCYAWMSSFFKLTGDVMPNSVEIHLEACEIKEIHAEVIILICYHFIWFNSFCFNHIVSRFYEKFLSGIRFRSTFWKVVEVLFQPR